MRIIIIGCGRMGSGLAVHLTREGHKITIIDSNRDAFSLLGPGFKGEALVGIGFDKGVLEKAEIGSADAVVACTNSDEANALIGRISRNIYKVPCVISRLYDPRKAELYQSLGIQTIGTTGWGILRVSEMLSYNQLDSILNIGYGQVELLRIEVPALLAGRPAGELNILGEIQIAALSRDSTTVIPTSGTILQKNDVVYLTVLNGAGDNLKRLLGLE